MTDKERIIQEIERRIHFLDGMINTDFGRGSLDTLNKVLDFINSLPAEQPNEDFEKEVDKQWNEEYRPYDSGYTIAELSLSDYKETARHFAQWQKEQTISKASQWLNENVVEYHPRKGELRPIVNINAFREAMEKEDEQ